VQFCDALEERGESESGESTKRTHAYARSRYRCRGDADGAQKSDENEAKDQRRDEDKADLALSTSATRSVDLLFQWLDPLRHMPPNKCAGSA
jgi:hypothetical protein